MINPHQNGRVWLRWIAAWVVLTVSGACVHHLLWTGQVGSPLSSTPLMESIGNCLHTLIAPGWIMLRLISRSWPTGSWEGPLTANAIGWAFWLVAIRLGLGVRRRFLNPTSSIQVAADQSRRRFMVDTPIALAAFGGAGGMVKGEFLDPWDLQVRRYSVPVADLPRELDGLRLVQVSDTHLGPRIPASFIREAIRRAVSLAPDLYCLTGDYIHNGKAFIEPAAELFRPLVATGRPVVAVLGNHDWYGDGHLSSRTLDAIGIRMVDNGRVFLDASRAIHYQQPADACLCIVGLGDMLTDWVDAAAALDGLPESLPRLVLAHNPDTADVVSGAAPYWRVGAYAKGFRPAQNPPRMDLVLSGHTHGGQVRLPLIGEPLVPSRFGRRYAGGLIQGKGFKLCISRGVGMSLLPVRYNVPPELVEVTLVRA